MGKAPKAPSSQTTVQEPWSAQKPYLEFGFQQARNLYDQGGPDYFPGGTLVAQSPETMMALDMGSRRAMQGSPLLRQSQDTLMATARGDYLNNPNIQAVIDATAGDIKRNYQEVGIPRIDSNFAGAGRYGSGAFQIARAKADEALQRNIGDASSRIRMQSYDSERQRQMHALSMLPDLAQQDYADIGKLASIGQTREDRAQDEINAEIDRYNFMQQRQRNALADYFGLIGGNFGGGTATSYASRTRSNPFLGAAGGALSGAGLASQLGLFGGTMSAATAAAQGTPWLAGTAAAASPWAIPLVAGAGLLGAFS